MLSYRFRAEPCESGACNTTKNERIAPRGIDPSVVHQPTLDRKAIADERGDRARVVGVTYGPKAVQTSIIKSVSHDQGDRTAGDTAPTVGLADDEADLGPGVDPAVDRQQHRSDNRSVFGDRKGEAVPLSVGTTNADVGAQRGLGERLVEPRGRRCSRIDVAHPDRNRGQVLGFERPKPDRGRINDKAIFGR